MGRLCARRREACRWHHAGGSIASAHRSRKEAGGDPGLCSAIRSACGQQAEYPDTIPVVHLIDRAFHPVRLHLDCADSGAPDQRADFGSAGRRGRGAKRQPVLSRHREGDRRIGDARPRLQRNDARTGGQRARTRKPAPLHGGDSRKHPDGSNFALRRRPHPAGEPRPPRPVLSYHDHLFLPSPVFFTPYNTRSAFL